MEPGSKNRGVGSRESRFAAWLHGNQLCDLGRPLASRSLHFLVGDLEIKVAALPNTMNDCLHPS